MPNCFKCERELEGTGCEPAKPCPTCNHNKSAGWPGSFWPATTFYSMGNFGSTVYDPMTNDKSEQLALHICDVCLLQHRNNIFQSHHLPKEVRQDVKDWYIKTGPEKAAS